VNDRVPGVPASTPVVPVPFPPLTPGSEQASASVTLNSTLDATARKTTLGAVRRAYSSSAAVEGTCFAPRDAWHGALMSAVGSWLTSAPCEATRVAAHDLFCRRSSRARAGAL
jgi:hypothetical protein